MRRWVLLGCAALACSFESSSSGSASGMGPASASTGEASSGTTTSEMSSTGAPSGETASGVTTEDTTEDTTVDPTGEPTTDPTVEPTTTGDGTTTTGDESSTTGDPSSPLSSVGLVARYFLDEAPAGSSPMFALDAADEPLDLPLEYVEETMHYVTDLGHRGLAFDQVGADDAARAPILNTKFEGLEGATELTFEVVLRLVDGMSSGSRIIHIGRNDNSVVTLAASGSDELEARWNGDIVRHWDYAAYTGTTHVVHLVIDTTAVNPDSRFRLLVDGSELDPIIESGITQGEPATVPADAIIALGNRHQDRAFRGVLFYAAIYGIPISDDTIAEHVSALMASDDAP